VVTEAGTHPKVAALVYVAAFVPDEGESVNTLIEGFPKDGPQPPILPPQEGFLMRMINPVAQREMSSRAGATVTETSGSHAIYVSRPEVVAEIIEKAASEVRSLVA
jgi:hypothetical protein